MQISRPPVTKQIILNQQIITGLQYLLCPVLQAREPAGEWRGTELTAVWGSRLSLKVDCKNVAKVHAFLRIRGTFVNYISNVCLKWGVEKTDEKKIRCKLLGHQEQAGTPLGKQEKVN